MDVVVSIGREDVGKRRVGPFESARALRFPSKRRATEHLRVRNEARTPSSLASAAVAALTVVHVLVDKVRSCGSRAGR